MVLPKCPVEVYQSHYELEHLLERYVAISPRRVLEIGSLFGGTLWYWMYYAMPGGHFVSVDLPVPPEDERRARQLEGHNGLWASWAHERGHTLTVIAGRSQDQTVIAQVQSYAPYDFVFIDGDHLYESVSQDFANFAPMVRPGGIVAFHDIDISKDNFPYWYGACQLWQELKRNYHTEEWIETPGWWGIGVLYIPEEGKGV